MSSDIEFVIGSSYANRKGTYVVKEVRENTLLVQYTDGETAELNIAIQKRVILNMSAGGYLSKEVSQEPSPTAQQGIAFSLPQENGATYPQFSYSNSGDVNPISDEPRQLKPDWKAIRQIAEANSIKCLYHFTDSSNLESIRQYRGLFSWVRLAQLGIQVSRPGGGELSRQLDAYKGLGDYVRLCFNPNQPMKAVAIKEGRLIQPVDLKIDLEILYWQETQFTDQNATANSMRRGNTAEHFKTIRFDLMKRRWQNEEEKALFQAEVLVKSSLPIKYIRNI